MRLLQSVLSVMIALAVISPPVYVASSVAGEPAPCKVEPCSLQGERAAAAQVAEPALPVARSPQRRTELEAISRSEAAAAQLSRKEKTAIRNMQAELDELDRQVAAMQSRMASGKPRANDRADAIKAMSAYRTEHAGRLEALRQQHENSEQRRLDEVTRLKKDFNEKWTAAVYAAVDRYQQVATNKYLRHKKDAAWETLTVEFAEAGEVNRHDVAAFLKKLEIALRPGLDQACHTDRENGLMWVKTGNLAGKVMTWNAALAWASALDYGGYSDWRLPTAAELQGLARSGGQRPADFLNKSGFSNVQAGLYWSSTVMPGGGNSLHRNVSMLDGSQEESAVTQEVHVWPVRETGLHRQKTRLEARE